MKLEIPISVAISYLLLTETELDISIGLVRLFLVTSAKETLLLILLPPRGSFVIVIF